MQIDDNLQFNHYYNQWGKNDFGFVAQRHNEAFGVVWLKYFTQQDRGFGFVNEQTPELSLCVFPQYRHCGLGKLLLGYAIDEAQKRHIASISLSVEPENRLAWHLYLSFGFGLIDGSNSTMQLIL